MFINNDVKDACTTVYGKLCYHVDILYAVYCNFAIAENAVTNLDCISIDFETEPIDRVGVKTLSNIHRWMKIHRTKLSGFLALILLVFSEPSNKTLIYGIIPILIGESIRIWSSGHIHKNEILTVTGPYSLSRNPLYVGSFILGTGFIIVMGVLWMAFVFLIFFATVYWFTVQWEEENLGQKFPDDWPVYRKSVPRFLPLFRIPRFSAGEFSWSQVTKHKELLNSLVVLAAYIILWGKAIYLG